MKESCTEVVGFISLGDSMCKDLEAGVLTDKKRSVSILMTYKGKTYLLDADVTDIDTSRKLG